MKEQIVVNSSLISYERFLAGNSGQTLLFLHGWRSSSEVWGGAMKHFHGRGANVYAIDFPGFGHSALPPHVFTLQDYANVVAGFVRKLELQKVCLVGHSFGGRVAIKLASAEQSWLSKLVLVGSAGFAMNKNKKNVMAMAAKIVKPFFKPKAMQGLRKKIYGAIGAGDYTATPELQKTFINVVNEDLTGFMEKISYPTLIVTGEKDAETPVAFGEKMRSLIPNSKFVILKSAGHFSFMDQPEEFFEAVEEFLK